MKKYLIDDKEVSQREFENSLDDELERYAEDTYDDMLDDCYPDIEIGCCTFAPSQVLSNCDPIAYRCGISDYVESLRGDYEDLDDFYIGDTHFQILEEYEFELER